MPAELRDPNSQVDDSGMHLAPGDAHYRAYVGPPQDYDLVAAMSFCLLVTLGLRQQHHVLDIGCGSLRVGRLLLPYLNPGAYTGLEPNRWLVDEGIRCEVGQDLVDIKKPRFLFATDASALVDGGDTYDFLFAQSIFSHCGPDLLAGWVKQAADLLDDQGVLVATYIEGQEDNTIPGWIYPSCVAYSSRTMEDIACRNGLQFVNIDWRHPRQRWMVMAKPGFPTAWLKQGGLSWNAAFDRFDARRQTR